MCLIQSFLLFSLLSKSLQLEAYSFPFFSMSRNPRIVTYACSGLDIKSENNNIAKNKILSSFDNPVQF